MNADQLNSERVVIVGGGVSGLSIACRLVQSGLPVTIVEASHVGSGASTRNQGWLHSGAWFALRDRDLAKECYESMQQTIRFCPDCIEPGHDGMAYLFSLPNSNTDPWTDAWQAAGIPFTEWNRDDLLQTAPMLADSPLHRCFKLPDRAFRPHVLVNHLAAAAQEAGVEVLTGTSVERLLFDGETVVGLQTGTGEELAARLVILAGNVGTAPLWPNGDRDRAGRQSEFQQVFLRANLLAVEPRLGSLPFCVVDSVGINHIPHENSSVFGNDRWKAVSRETQPTVASADSLAITEGIATFLPRLDLDSYNTKTWAGITVQAMHAEQVEPGRVQLPTVIDHERDAPSVGNLLSVFAGRATLWPQLAEQTRDTVLSKLQLQCHLSSRPPWDSAAV